MTEFFEDLVVHMGDLYTVAIHKALPLAPEAREAWSTPDTLDWLGLGYEKEMLLVQYTCGESFSGIFDAMPVRQALAGEEQTKCQTIQRILRTFSDDDETRDALALASVGLIAASLDRQHERMPIDVAPAFRVQAFDDGEAAEDPANVPYLPQNEATLEMIRRICRNGDVMVTLMEIYQSGGKPNLVDFLVGAGAPLV